MTPPAPPSSRFVPVVRLLEGEGLDEPAGDVAAAMEVISGLDGPETVPTERFTEVLATADRAQLLQGFATFVGAFMSLFEPMDLVAPVLRRLQNLHLVPEPLLPTIGGVLVAAALGQSPSGWRRGYGDSVTGQEAQAWCYTAWALADLIDFVHGEGTIDSLTGEVFGRGVDGDDR